METASTAAHGAFLTPEAAAKIKVLLAQEDRDDYRLRIAVESGGCSGLKYQMFFDERVEEGDSIVEFDGVGLIVDEKSAPFLAGAKIDFHDSIEKQGFDIDNPNATSSCACGESFC